MWAYENDRPVPDFDFCNADHLTFQTEEDYQDMDACCWDRIESQIDEERKVTRANLLE